MSMGTGEMLLQQADRQQARLEIFARRKFVNRVALSLSLAAMAFGLFWLFWILFETIRLGLGGLTLATLTEMTPPPNDEIGRASCRERVSSPV